MGIAGMVGIDGIVGIRKEVTTGMPDFFRAAANPCDGVFATMATPAGMGGLVAIDGVTVWLTASEGLEAGGGADAGAGAGADKLADKLAGVRTSAGARTGVGAGPGPGVSAGVDTSALLDRPFPTSILVLTLCTSACPFIDGAVVPLTVGVVETAAADTVGAGAGILVVAVAVAVVPFASSIKVFPARRGGTNAQGNVDVTTPSLIGEGAEHGRRASRDARHLSCVPRRPTSRLVSGMNRPLAAVILSYYTCTLFFFPNFYVSISFLIRVQLPTCCSDPLLSSHPSQRHPHYG